EPNSGRLDVRAADGQGAEAIANSASDADGSASEEVLATGQALAVEDAAADEQRCQPLAEAGVLGPALFVPLSMEGNRVGTLAVGRVAGRSPFNDVDRWLVESFASQVSLALEYGLAHVELRRVAVAADQERIARDLHDTVIQQLFAIGMSLQALARTIPDAAGADRVHQAVDALDLTIRDIRGTVFELQNPPGHSDGLRAEVFALAAELCPPYELAYHVRFQGPVDTAVTDDIAVHVLGTLREALSNAGRHARASRVEIDLDVDGCVQLRVRDNGVGMAERSGRHSGLRNLAKRATALGGSMEIKPNPTGGTLLVWRAPLTPP
ncbi:MAG: GAF domain-containing sensor histidine kinase, partial [Acidimicrobiales bacterium]